MRQETYDLRADVGLLRQQKEDLEATVQELKADIAAVEQELGASQGRVGELQEHVAGLEETVKEIETENASLSQQLDESQVKVEELKEQISDLEAMLQSWPSDRLSVGPRLDTLHSPGLLTSMPSGGLSSFLPFDLTVAEKEILELLVALAPLNQPSTGRPDEMSPVGGPTRYCGR